MISLSSSLNMKGSIPQISGDEIHKFPSGNLELGILSKEMDMLLSGNTLKADEKNFSLQFLD